MTAPSPPLHELLDEEFNWTPRQKQVLDLLAKRRTNGEIAEELGVSLDGAKWHVREVLSKLNVQSRDEAAEYWRAYNGWPRRLRRALGAISFGVPLRWAGGIAGAVLLAGIVAAVAVVLIRSGDSDEAAAPDVTPTPVDTDATPTPDDGDGGNGRDAGEFALVPAPGALEYLQGGPEDIAPGSGVYFLDVDTGDLEGWRGGMSFSLASDNRFVFKHPDRESPENLLIDRDTGAIYTWDGAVRPMSSGGHGNRWAPPPLTATAGRLIFRIPQSEVPDRFAIVDFENGTDGAATVAEFEAEADAMVLSLDGERVLIGGREPRILDAASGTVIDLGPLPTGSKLSPVRTTLDGGAIFAAIVDANGAIRGWQHYVWDGGLLAQGQARTEEFHLSPRGDLVGFVEPMVQAAHGPENRASMVRAVDTLTGEPVFRVPGASTCYVLSAGNRWLADSSAMAVSVPYRELPPGQREQSDYWNAYGLATRDGELLPFHPRVREPIPSPASKSTFVIRDGDASGRDVPAVVEVEPGRAPEFTWQLPEPGIRQWLPPFSGVGYEVRVVTPVIGMGMDGCGPTSLVRPYVDFPPYDDPPRLRLYDEADGMALLDAPGGSEVVGHVSTSMQLAIIDLETQEWDFLYAGIWAHVQTTNGQEGWLLLDLISEGMVSVTRWTPLLVDTGGSCLNVREAPSTDAAVLDCYADGVPLVEHQVSHLLDGDDADGWVPVWTPDGRSGWAAEEFLR